MNDETLQRRSATVIMAGLPKTGKTTFLGALYHVLESGESSDITLSAMPKVRRHLEEVRHRWLQVEPETRTSASSPIMNDFSVSVQGRQETVELRWPDLSGEYFEEMVRKRTLNRDVDAILKDATAVLFFVHPQTLSQSPRIADLNRLASLVPAGQGPAADEEEQDKENAEPIEWDATMVPGEVLTVELLQRMVAPHFEGRIEKVAVVLSAWDQVRKTFESPNAYFEKQAPLLHQFVEANWDEINTKVYGVSALGGDPVTDKNRLLLELEATKRIQVVDHAGASMLDGIVAPIKWLLE